MSHKNRNRKTADSAISASASSRRHEWVVLCHGCFYDVPVSSLIRREQDGTFAFRDDQGTVAEFPCGVIVQRKPPEADATDPAPAGTGRGK